MLLLCLNGIQLLRFWSRFEYSCILFTNVIVEVSIWFPRLQAKGFPDINTRIFLKKIWENLKIPILALMDADPHGMSSPSSSHPSIKLLPKKKIEGR